MPANARDCYIFDIDAALWDVSRRLHILATEPKNWRAFFAPSADDKPIAHVRGVVRELSKVAAVVFVSERSDAARDETEEWLGRETGMRGPLYMRKAGDSRSDYVVKAELLEQIIADGYRPLNGVL